MNHNVCLSVGRSVCLSVCLSKKICPNFEMSGISVNGIFFHYFFKSPPLPSPCAYIYTDWKPVEKKDMLPNILKPPRINNMSLLSSETGTGCSIKKSLYIKREICSSLSSWMQRLRKISENMINNCISENTAAISLYLFYLYGHCFWNIFLLAFFYHISYSQPFKWICKFVLIFRVLEKKINEKAYQQVYVFCTKLSSE